MGEGFKAFLKRNTTPRRLLFYVAWYSIHAGLFAFGWYKQQADQRLAPLNKLKFSVWFSRGSGLALGLDCSLIFLPILRNIIRLVRPHFQLLDLDKNIFFHRQCAYSLLFFTIVHTTGHYVNFINVEKLQLRPVKAWEIHYAQAGGITGHIMLLCMFLMFTTAHIKIRKQSFETFYYTHMLSIVFAFALLTHATGCFVRDTPKPYSPFAGANFWNHCIGYEVWRFTIFGPVLYFCERVWAFFRSRRDTRLARIIQHPAGTIELQIVKPSLKYVCGEWILVNIPSISKGQWHPFSVTSCPSDPYVSVHIRQVGDWTKQLGRMVENQLEFKGQKLPKIKIDGPFGAPSDQVFDYESVILIGAGIGVTPFASVLKEICYRRRREKMLRTENLKLRKVEFIWVCKQVGSFAWFRTLLEELELSEQIRLIGNQINQVNKPGFLNIHSYLTQRADSDMINYITMNESKNGLDPLTGLQTRTNFGRPNFDTIFSKIHDQTANGYYIPGFEKSLNSKVGVFFCGPPTLARQISALCSKKSSSEVKFDFHKENF